MEIDVEKSLKYSRQIGARVRDCYTNCAKALIVIDELHDYTYVEGFAVADIHGMKLPVEHAWLQNDAEIVDITWVISSLDGVTAKDYYPAIYLTVDDLAEMLYINDDLDLPISMYTTSYADAWRLAMIESHVAAYGEEIRAMLT